jgi:type II secretory pathway pseudopilin PulG
LLVSLGVLGLIAGLTIPNVVISVERSKNRAVLKEAFQVISSLTAEGVMNGDFAGITSWDSVNQNGAGSIANYISGKLNYTKQCLTADVSSAGCVRAWVGSPPNSPMNTHNARWILPNGAKITADSSGLFNAGFMQWIIVAKAYDDDIINTGANPTGINIRCNNTEDPILVDGSVAKAGQCIGVNLQYRTTLDLILGNA